MARGHVWLCDGKCAKNPPFFGVVMRSYNRPPGPQDWWFSKHQATCGGKYIKVVEPDLKKTTKPKPKKQLEKAAEK